MQSTTESSAPIISPIQNRCFGCGPESTNGLHLEFSLNNDMGSVCLTTISSDFESYPGYLHGGIIATILDEAMSKAIRTQGISAMTAEMKVRYLRPVPSQKSIRIEGQLLRNEGRNYWAEATILDAKGHVLAKSEGHFVHVRKR